ncbi:20775_t:CDS:2, partial [Racocetra persica]
NECYNVLKEDIEVLSRVVQGNNNKSRKLESLRTKLKQNCRTESTPWPLLVEVLTTNCERGNTQLMINSRTQVIIFASECGTWTEMGYATNGVVCVLFDEYEPNLVIIIVLLYSNLRCAVGGRTMPSHPRLTV